MFEWEDKKCEDLSIPGENDLNINKIVRVWWLEDVNEWKVEMRKIFFLKIGRTKKIVRYAKKRKCIYGNFCTPVANELYLIFSGPKFFFVF